MTFTSEIRIGPATGKADSKVEIPITFADDQSFTGQAPVNTQAGVVASLPGLAAVCQAQAVADMAIKASGNATETPQKHVMHIQLDSSAGATNGTATCPSGSVGISKQTTGQSLPSFDLKGIVGEAIERPVIPYPGVNSNLHLEIVKREP